MKKNDMKRELKNALYYLFLHDYRIEIFSQTETGIKFNFYHLSEINNSFVFCSYDGGITTHLQLAKPTNQAITKAEKVASAFVTLTNEGKYLEACKILDFFIERSKKVFESKFSINFDVAFYNL